MQCFKTIHIHKKVVSLKIKSQICEFADSFLKCIMHICLISKLVEAKIVILKNPNECNFEWCKSYYSQKSS